MRTQKVRFQKIGQAMDTTENGWMRHLAALVVLIAGCAPTPMLIGPPSTIPPTGARFSAGASWAKPADSSDFGVPQVDAAMHLPVGGSFDIAVRAWSLGAGIQGRLFPLSRASGGAVDLMVAPLVGVSTLLEPKPEGSEKFLGPISPEFLVAAPVVVGFGAGTCSIFGGGEAIAHLRPELAVLRAGIVAGFACPISEGRLVAPELAFELPVLGGADLRPEDGYVPGERRHPLLAKVVRFGVSFSF